MGSDTITKGTYAITASMVLVLLFMLCYYRFAGVVACMALLTNLVLLLAIMIVRGVLVGDLPLESTRQQVITAVFLACVLGILVVLSFVFVRSVSTLTITAQTVTLRVGLGRARREWTEPLANYEGVFLGIEDGDEHKSS